MGQTILCPGRLFVCVFMIFLVSPRSYAALDGMHHMKTMRSHNPYQNEDNNEISNFFDDEFLNPNSIHFGGNNQDDFRTASEFSGNEPRQFQIPEQLLNEIMESAMHQGQSQYEESRNDAEGINELQNGAMPNIKYFFAPANENSIIDSDNKDLPVIENLKDESTVKPSPTPATPILTSETPVSSVSEPAQPRHSFKIYVSHNPTEEYNNVIGSSDQGINNSPDMKDFEKSESDKENHAKNLWKSTIPVLVKNNKALVHSKIDYDDMSQILPDLPMLLEKLHDVHKPGHVSVMIMNPRHLPIDKKVVKQTKICCEMRHILIHTINKNDEPLIESPKGLQDFLGSLVQPQNVGWEPTEEDYQDVNENNTPWNEDEENVVSHIMNHLHLFDQPGHLSAISFNPRHIAQNKNNPTLIHIKIKISQSSSESSGLDNPHNEEYKSPAYDESYNNNDAFESHRSAEPDQDQFTSEHMVHMRMKFSHNGALTVHELPLNNFYDKLNEVIPETITEPEPLSEAESSRSRMTMFYFIVHNRDNPSPSYQEKPTNFSPSSSNLQTLLRNVFQIPVSSDLSNAGFEPLQFEEVTPLNEFPDSLSEEPFLMESTRPSVDNRVELPSIRELLEHATDQAQYQRGFPAEREDFTETPRWNEESVPQFSQLIPIDSENTEGLPLNFLKQLNSEGLNFPPQHQFSHIEDERIVPERSSVDDLLAHLSGLRIIPSPVREEPASTNEVFRRLRG